MGRIKIEDLPEDQKISNEEMRKVFGGVGTWIKTGPLWLKSGHFGYQEVDLAALGGLRARFESLSTKTEPEPKF